MVILDLAGRLGSEGFFYALIKEGLAFDYHMFQCAIHAESYGNDQRRLNSYKVHSSQNGFPRVGVGAQGGNIPGIRLLIQLG